MANALHSLGAIVRHWGDYEGCAANWREALAIRKEIGASAAVLVMAIAFDAVVLVAFTAMKLESDPTIVVYALIGIAAVFAFERRYLSRWVAPAAD